MKFHRILILFILPIYLFSCKTPQKLPYYLDHVTDSSARGEVKVPELKIQKNDLLSIQVFSQATDPLFDAPYNLTTAATSGFLVDPGGNIQYPKLGTFHAEGLTKQELAAEIRKRLTEPVELLRDPTVVIRFLNFKVTVLGQVGSEGVVNVPGESLTILQAVGLAGGITDFGKKNEVKILRETNGTRETGVIDLSSKDLFESPYYNLVQNDVLIIGTTNERAKDAEQAKTMQKISFALAMVTVAATLANIFIR